MSGAWDAIASGYASLAANFTGAFVPELLAAAGISTAPATAALSVLDVAAGSGAVALAAAMSPGVNQVHACDFSKRMLAELATQAVGLPPDAAPIQTTACDCEALSMAADSFDCAVSNFGVIFASEVVGGLAEMARVTRPGGRLCFTSWGSTPAFKVIDDRWRELFPADAPNPIPETAAEEAVAQIQQQLASVGGLVDISITAVEHELVVSCPEAYWERMLVSSPSRLVNMKAKLAPSEILALKEATIKHLKLLFPGEGEQVKLTAQAFVATATKQKARELIDLECDHLPQPESHATVDVQLAAGTAEATPTTKSSTVAAEENNAAGARGLSLPPPPHRARLPTTAPPDLAGLSPPTRSPSASGSSCTTAGANDEAAASPRAFVQSPRTLSPPSPLIPSEDLSPVSAKFVWSFVP